MRSMRGLLLGILFLGFTSAAAEDFWQPPLELMGGVSVGNGGRVFAGMIEGHFANEELLLKQVNETMGMIKRGEHPRVRQWIRQGGCLPKMEFDSVDVFTNYKSVDGEWQKGVMGYSKIKLKNCRNPYDIQADESPQGPDEDFDALEFYID